MEKVIQIALLGAGTVGSGVVKVLEMNRRQITERVGAPIQLKTVLVRTLGKARPELASYQVTDKIEDILNDEEIDVVVELMGGIHPAREYMLRAMEAGKSVVTANKDVVAQFGKDMFDMAERQDVDFLFEASVGGGIPIITPLKQCLTANKVTEIMGIVNGTTNYMLTKMTECGSDYNTVLKEAQEKGYAEANPSADVDGLDAARKAAILASLAFNTRVELKDVSVEGITKITPADIDYAKNLGYVIKLLAVGKDSPEHGVDVRVHPVFLPEDHPLASVNGVFNAIFVRGNAIGEAMFYGQGAGSLPTASAVVSDIIDVSRDILHHTFGRVRCTCYEKKKLCPLKETESSYYVRLLVDDKPGVLGFVATAFGDAGVSLKSVIQTQRNIIEHAEIVAITHMVRHEQMEQALDVLNGLPVVDEIRSVIRVEKERG
ncbi:homoserine dehydrogenase [Selenomonas montiformis]|uniref:Homoserine dehydrogenase n=1 Tax=Selenomonas montiformis TaxID=2652285 RepID=A0A6I2UVW2_9FIRM|nr:homoserine dehydrogenase [Selenomonas montiformis]MDY4697279.1 homoserine dehydrogenase [Selenomonas montiformis]MSV25367.1 homoserine dehydrogenase [Selenomonas montiformis]